MENGQLIPELRFPEFDKLGQYDVNSFVNIFDFSSGKNIKQNEALPEYKTPCVRYGELYHLYNEVITEITNYTNLDKSELVFSEGDEILLPSAGEDPLDIASASALTLKNVAIGRTINVLKPKQHIELSTIFVSYYINQKLRRKISRMARGASISNVYNSDLKKLKINLPIIKEQQKIANFLTAIDQRITLLKQKKAALEQYKKGLMQEFFSQEVRFRDDGNNFPDWEAVFLKNIVVSIKNGTSAKQVNENIGYKVTRIETISSGVINLNKTGYVHFDENLEPYRMRKGDILFSNINSVKHIGKVAFYDLNEELFHGMNLLLIRADESICNSKFLFNLLSSQFMKRRFETICNQAVNQASINQTDLGSEKVLLPSIKEQQKIANFLSSIDQKINAIDKQIAHSELFKKGLLQRMFV